MLIGRSGAVAFLVLLRAGPGSQPPRGTRDNIGAQTGVVGEESSVCLEIGLQSCIRISDTTQLWEDNRTGNSVSTRHCAESGREPNPRTCASGITVGPEIAQWVAQINEREKRKTEEGEAGKRWFAPQSLGRSSPAQPRARWLVRAWDMQSGL